MRFPRRVQALLASFLALIVLALSLDVVVLRIRERESDERASTLSPARLQAQALLTSLLDQETGQRGYLLTGDETFLETYERGGNDAAMHLAELRRMLAGHDDLLAGLQRVRSRVTAWQDLGAGFEITARRGGRVDVVEALVAGGTSRDLFEAARTELDELQYRLALADMSKRADVNRLDTVLIATDLGALILAVGLIAVAALLARRWFTRPLQALSTSVQAVAGGALRSSVTVEGPPEFVELAGDVDAMRRRILAEVEEAERAREALAERGMIVLTLREELAAAQPALPDGVELAGRFAPAQGIVAGDWYDVVPLDGGRLAVALVDVSGHGAGVGAFALRTKALTLAALRSHPPGEAFSWLSDRLGDTGEQFLTGVVLVLDPATGTLEYASAGHPPLLLAGVTGVAELGATGPLLGPLGGAWTTERVVLERGGAIVAFSDGLIEARSDDGEPFGVRRLAEIVERTQLEGPARVADACLESVQRHQARREDDLTLVVVAR
ncbi:MAG TPA: SpoIIE family protein phosphatase [Acidimicrobiales bacterium]|nr:SpoIIE family protein phosphatase [Acidimicrobiales bacterium]